MKIFDSIRCEKITNVGFKYMNDKILMNLESAENISSSKDLQAQFNNMKRKAEEQIDNDRIFKKNKIQIKSDN